MSARNRRYQARRLSDELLQQMGQDLTPVRKDEFLVYRGAERTPIISISAPGRGRFTRHAIRMIGDLAEDWRQSSRFPQALRALRGGLASYILMEPVVTYDQHAPDQYPINWARGNRLAYIDLLPILQPRNLDVAQEYVAELPVSLEDLPNGKSYLVVDLSDVHIRREKEIPKEAEAEFEAQDEDLTGDHADNG